MWNWISGFILGLTSGLFANFAYGRLIKYFAEVPESTLEKIDNWDTSGNDIFYKRNVSYKIVFEEGEKFPFYRETKNGLQLITYNELVRDTFLRKEIWDFCDRVLPIYYNEYQIVRAKFMSSTTELFSTDLLRIDLKHYPETGVCEHFFIPQNLSLLTSRNYTPQTLEDKKEYKICRILYAKFNDGSDSNNKILELLDWDYINNPH